MGYDNYYDSYYGNSSANSGAGLIVLIVIVSLAVCVLFGLLARSEAKKQYRNETGWFFLGFFFMINAFLALKVSKAADDEGHSVNLWSTLGIFFGVGAIIAFESALNAENKYHDFDCWVIIGFAFGLFALFVSCFLKPFEPVKENASQKQTVVQKPKVLAPWTCSKCGNVNTPAALFCSKCGNSKNA